MGVSDITARQRADALKNMHEVRITHSSLGLCIRVWALKEFAPRSLDGITTRLNVKIGDHDTCIIEGRIRHVPADLPGGGWYAFIFLTGQLDDLRRLVFLPPNGKAQNVRTVTFATDGRERCMENPYAKAPPPPSVS